MCDQQLCGCALQHALEQQALDFMTTRAKGLDLALSLADVDATAPAYVLDHVVRGRTSIVRA